MSSLINWSYTISISGKELGDEFLPYIQRVHLRKVSNGSSLLTIVVEDADYNFISEDLFIEEADIKFVGRIEGKKHEFDGYISLVDVNFPEQGTPSLTLNCMDTSHLMNAENKTRNWEGKRLDEVARDIAKDYGLKVDADKLGSKQNFSQSSQSDIKFLTESAKSLYDVEAYCKVIGDTLILKKKNVIAKPMETISYREKDFKLKSFRPRIDKTTVKKEITKTDVDISSKSVESHTSTDSNTNRDVAGSEVVKPEPEKSKHGYKYVHGVGYVYQSYGKNADRDRVTSKDKNTVHTKW